MKNENEVEAEMKFTPFDTHHDRRHETTTNRESVKN